MSKKKSTLFTCFINRGFSSIHHCDEPKFFATLPLSILFCVRESSARRKQKFVIEDYNACNFSGSGGCRPDTFTITWHMAGTALAATLVIIVGAALWTIRKRDIT